MGGQRREVQRPSPFPPTHPLALATSGQPWSKSIKLPKHLKLLFSWERNIFEKREKKKEKNSASRA